jgi:hypothetical protein
MAKVGKGHSPFVEYLNTGSTRALIHAWQTAAAPYLQALDEESELPLELRLGPHQLISTSTLRKYFSYDSTKQSLRVNATLTPLTLNALFYLIDRGGVKKLDIGEENKGVFAQASPTNLFANFLQMNTSLQSFYINDCPGSGNTICAALQTNQRLRKLRIIGTSIDDIGAEHIAKLLKTNARLIKLNLSYNSIGTAGVRDIVEGLANHSHLTHLKLGNNNIGDDGALLLAQLLESNTTLEMVAIDSCAIGSDGIQAITNALVRNTTLTRLNIMGNRLSEQETEAVYEAIRRSILEHGRIRDIDIDVLRRDDGWFEISSDPRLGRLLLAKNKEVLAANPQRLEEEFRHYFKRPGSLTSKNIAEFKQAYRFTIQAAEEIGVSTELRTMLVSDSKDLLKYENFLSAGKIISFVEQVTEVGEPAAKRQRTV